MNSEYSINNPLQVIAEIVFDAVINSIFPGASNNKFIKNTVKPFSSIITLFFTLLLLLIVIIPSLLVGATITGSIGSMESVMYSGLPEALIGYVEEGFEDTGFPRGNPFGGRGFEYATKTAGYRDLGYYQYYNRWHDGLDMVPGPNYYASNEAHQILKEPVMFATCSGFATSLIDGAGALYVSIDCRDGIQLWYVHNKVNFIPQEGTQVRAGQPIAIMGNTGNSDGAHVHYVVRLPSYSGYIFVDPELYL